MEYTNHSAVIVRVGKKNTEFANGTKVTKKMGNSTVPGVKVGVIFDFDKDVWYDGILTEQQAEQLVEGKKVDITTWNKEFNGKTYKNFGFQSQKGKTESAVKDLLPLVQIVERQGKQIMTLHSEITKIKEYLSKKETTTMFDDDAKDVHPEQFGAIYGEEPPLEAYETDVPPGDIAWDDQDF